LKEVQQSAQAAGAGQDQTADQAAAQVEKQSLFNRNRARVIRCVTILKKLVEATEPNASKQSTLTRGIPIVFNVVVMLDLVRNPTFPI